MDSLYQYGINKLKEKVIFIGSVNNIHEYLKASDIFILNSTKEGMPNALLEAMASGLPSIVSHLEGVNDFITFNRINSIVVENDAGLKKAIKELIRNKDFAVKLGQKASKFITKKYSIKNVAEKTINRFVF